MVFIDIDGKEKEQPNNSLSQRDFTELEAEAQQHAAEAQAQDTARYEGIAPADSTGQAILNQTHQELRDAAQNLRTLSTYFSRIKDSIRPAGEGDELDEELQDYLNGSFGFDKYKIRLYNTVDLIGQLTSALEEYANRNTKVSRDKKERVVGLEADQFIQIQTMLDSCIKNLNGCLFYAESNSKMFRNLYSQIVNTTVMLENMADGHLIRPLPGEKKDAYGRKIHRKSVFDSSLFIESKSLNKDIAEKVKEGENVPGRYFTDVSDMPIFPHEPNEDDLSQGWLGDCYMLATLAAVVRKDPAKIKEHIRDNKDGTVTVLFYNQQKEPVYVTVQKSIPTIEDEHIPFSSGPLWVKLIEKAYAASGLKQREETVGKSYKNIEGGREMDFFHAFLGPEVTDEDVFESNEILYSNTNGSNYSAEELATFNLVQQSLQSGAMVTAGTRSPEEYKKILAKIPDPLPRAGTNGLEQEPGRRFAGINRKHAYTVVGTVEKNGIKYIRLRNPHNTAGMRFNQYGVLEAKNDMQGEAYVELRNFRMLFNELTKAKTYMSPTDRTKIPQARQFIAAYGDSLREMIRDVKATEYLFNLELNDSPQFRALDRAARSLSAALETNPPLMTPISRLYEEFTASARAYQRYRTEPLTDADALARRARNERTTRSRNRLAVTDRILRFADQLEQDQVQAAQAAQAAQAQARPDLQAQINEVRPVPQGKYSWLTAELLNERVSQKKALLQEENFAEVGTEDLNKTVKQFANPRFKELRQILCEGDIEENEAINTALLEARAYILAGHSAEDLRKTDLADNISVAPYFDLIAQAVLEDRAQRENDMTAAEEAIRQQRPDFRYAPAAQQAAAQMPAQQQAPVQEAIHEPAQGQEEAVQAPVQEAAQEPEEPEEVREERRRNLQMAQEAIQSVLAAPPRETAAEKELRHWNILDKKYGIPRYRNNPKREKLGNIAHVKMEDRPARKEQSRRAAQLFGQVLGRIETARKATEGMIQRKFPDPRDKRACRDFINEHENIIDAFISHELTPEAISKNVERIRALAAGTPEQKAAALQERMNELAAQATSCQIEESYTGPNHTMQQFEQHADRMMPVRRMETFLLTAEGQHCGVSLDNISKFRKTVTPELEKFTSYYYRLYQIKDPLYQYINKKSAADYLQECGDKITDSLKKFDDELKAKQALPRGRKKDEQIKEIKENIKYTLAGILAVTTLSSEMGKKDIRDAATTEYLLSDYSLNKKVLKIMKSEGFKTLVDEVNYQPLIKTGEDGKITMDRQAARNLMKLFDAFEKSVDMNKQLEEDQKALEEANRQPQAPENTRNAQAAQINPL